MFGWYCAAACPRVQSDTIMTVGGRTQVVWGAVRHGAPRPARPAAEPADIPAVVLSAEAGGG